MNDPDRPGPSPGWNRGAVWTSVVLAAWAGMLWFLLLTGRWALYLSTRSFWVVPLGAVILTLGAAGRLVGARRSGGRRWGTGDTWALGLVALPIITVLALPPATLGAYAVSRRAGFAGAGIVPSASHLASGSLTFLDIADAEVSPEVMRALAKRAGTEVRLVGFVTRDPDMPSDQFKLTQFVVTCCINDALVAEVHVVDVPAASYPQGQWVEVTGTIYPVPNDVLLDAALIKKIPRPSHPYLTP